MKRREFMKALLAGAGSAMLHTPSGLAQQDYNGRYLVVMHAAGGWDVTSLCDPKMNVRGELEINRWSRGLETQTAGNLRYAPFGNNAELFSRHFDKMLVINGVDTQTNAHEAGVVHTWSGRLSNGYPSITALFAAINGPQMPMNYINFGGYGETANLTRYTRISDVYSLRSLLAPNRPPWDNSRTFIPDSELQLILAAQDDQLRSLLRDDSRLPRYHRLARAQRQSFRQTSELDRYLDVIPDDASLAPFLYDFDPAGPVEQSILQQAQLSVLAFKSNVACAADLIVHSFDTHGENDAAQEPKLGTFARGVDYLWDYAEQQDIADRLTVILSSDFGRTPFYNSTDGKDHWPIGSVIVMEKNAPWGNRVVGVTDEGHNALPINPRTLQRDYANGTLIYPRHVHQALRKHLGIANHAFLSRFQFPQTEDFNFFNPSRSTPWHVSG